VNHAIPIISSTREDYSPSFSPDGKKIAFVSDRTGTTEIWVCNSDGSNAVQLTFLGGVVNVARWSPDGERIVFGSSAEGEYDIWMVDAKGGKPQRISEPPANDGNPIWSRDGQSIYFDSMRSGEQQVWKMPSNGGSAVQVTQDGGFSPIEASDGKFIYYTKQLYDTQLWRIPVGGGQARKVLEPLRSYQNLAITDRGAYFVRECWRQGHGGACIQFLSFATNRITVLADIEKSLVLGPLGGLDVSPDGRSILYTQSDQENSEVMLVENFH
jgi:Tol biopolymer transport system component